MTSRNRTAVSADVGSRQATARSAVISGDRALLAEVTAAIRPGLPGTAVSGLPDTALREARDRIRAAVLSSGCTWPRAAITLTVPALPGRTRTSGLDLAIALAILAADGQVPGGDLDTVMFFAELGLDGALRPVPGIPVAAAAAREAGLRCLVTAVTAAGEQAHDIQVQSVPSLGETFSWLRSPGRRHP